MPFDKRPTEAGKKGICGICHKNTTILWLFLLSQYNSLRNVNKLDICEDCAEAIYKVSLKLSRDSKGVPVDWAELKCPECGVLRYTNTPKVPAPCDNCGCIYSLTSIRMEKLLNAKLSKIMVKDRKTGKRKIVTREIRA
ncbi:MAG: hypothetical protein Q8M92_08740 [Candidatus Subteraquimicrobiales bacterium]|nr:hypothetical protein [Candidatus Subteraquimicrobiales bacterium]